MIKSQKAFTLIELLIVIVIIGLLMAIAVPAYSQFLVRGRDTKRKADLKVIQSALQQYYTDQGYFPTSISFGGSLNSGSRSYLKNIPDDPLYDASDATPIRYGYVKDGSCNNTSVLCTTYCLYAKFEDTRNIESEAAPGASAACPASGSYNYFVSP